MDYMGWLFVLSISDNWETGYSNDPNCQTNIQNIQNTMHHLRCYAIHLCKVFSCKPLRNIGSQTIDSCSKKFLSPDDLLLLRSSGSCIASSSTSLPFSARRRAGTKNGGCLKELLSFREALSQDKELLSPRSSLSGQGALCLDSGQGGPPSPGSSTKSSVTLFPIRQGSLRDHSCTTCNTQCGLFPLGAGWFRKPERGIVMSTVGIDGAIINHLRMDVAHWWVCGLGMGLNIFGWGEV